MCDLDQVKALLTQEQNEQLGMFISHTDIDSYMHKLKSSAEILTYYIDGTCAGFIAFYCNNIELQSSYITLLLVAPAYRGRHIAGALIDSVVFITQSRGFSFCSLEVKKNNIAALRLYERKGFTIYEIRNDSFIMQKRLT